MLSSFWCCFLCYLEQAQDSKYKLSRVISIHYLYYIMDPLNGVPLLVEMHTVKVSFQNPLPCRLLTDPLDD